VLNGPVCTSIIDIRDIYSPLLNPHRQQKGTFSGRAGTTPEQDKASRRRRFFDGRPGRPCTHASAAALAAAFYSRWSGRLEYISHYYSTCVAASLSPSPSSGAPTSIGHARCSEQVGALVQSAVAWPVGPQARRCAARAPALRLCGLCDGWRPRSLQKGGTGRKQGCSSSAIQTLAVNARRQGIFSGCAGPNACNATVPALIYGPEEGGPPLFIPLLSIGVAGHWPGRAGPLPAGLGSMS